MLNHIKTERYMNGWQSHYEYPLPRGVSRCCRQEPNMAQVYDDVPGCREKYYIIACECCNRGIHGSTPELARDNWNNSVLSGGR